MASRKGKELMSFKRFMLRRQVLGLYKDIMRTVQKVPSVQQRKELVNWVRGDFKQNKHHTEEDTIKMMITQGRMSLKELQQTIPSENTT